MKTVFSRVTALFLAVLLGVLLCPIGTFADEVAEDSVGIQDVKATALTAETGATASSSRDTKVSGTCGAEGDNLTWTFDSSTGKLTISGTGKMKEYTYGQAPWYSHHNAIKTVEIAEGVASIGDYAFDGCSSLTSIEMPSSVTSIGERAFFSCSSLTSVSFGENSQLTSIGSQAFYWCGSLTSIEIPSSVTSVGNSAFSGCSNLTNITILSRDAEIYDSSSTIPSVTTIYGYADSTAQAYAEKYGNKVVPIAFSGWGGMCGAEENNLQWRLDRNTGILTISGTGDMQDYKSYAPWRNYNSYIRSVVIEDGVTSIGERAFYGCEQYITDISIANSVESIGSSAFSGCVGLTEITLPKNLTEIGASAFGGCTALTSIELPASLSVLNDSAFNACYELENITIQEGNVYFCVEDDILYNADKTKLILISSAKQGELIILDSVQNIGSQAFSNSKNISSIKLQSESKNYTVEDDILYNKEKTSIIAVPGRKVGTVIIADGVTEIGSAFWGCSLVTKIVIPDSVTRIGSSAFRECASLKSITIPSSVLSIGDRIFNGCASLEEVVIPASVEHMDGYVFYGCENLKKVEFESGSNLSDLAECTFYGCVNLESLVMPENITSIGFSAFRNCTSLTSIVIPESVTSIGNGAFSGCSNLESITILSRDVVIDSSIYTIPLTITVYGYIGSTAQAYAERNGNKFVALSEEEPEPSTDQARAGETVTLTISLQDVPSVKSMMLYDFIYDSAYVEIVEAKWLVDGIIATWDPDTGEALMAYEANTDTAGGVLELVIRIKEGTPDGMQEIGFSAILKQKVESGEEVTLDVAVVGGGVEVVSYITGDINGDETIDSDDAIYLLKYTFLPETYPIGQSGDMNGDGRVDSDDAIYLLKYTFLPERYPLPE